MRNHPINHLILKLHLQAKQLPAKTIQKTNFATTPNIQPNVISDPPNTIYKQSQNDTTGIPSTVWQQQMANARMEIQYIIHSDHPYLNKRNSHNNDSETHILPLQTTEDYNPQYYDPEYGKDPYWDDELYDKTNLQFRNEDRPPTDDEDDPDIIEYIVSSSHRTLAAKL